MLTQTATKHADSHIAASLESWRPGVWHLRGPKTAGLVMGITDRTIEEHALTSALRIDAPVIQAAQVHGASIAVVETAHAVNPLPGCDALITRMPGVALGVRTADCVPLTVWDPVQRVIGLAHVGWRGAEKRLPMRLVSAIGHYAQSRPQDVWISLGPSIRACCFEVGPEFTGRFPGFVRQVDGRWKCDLVRCVADQLHAAGVASSRIIDTGLCTACDLARWYSVRREGQATGRLLSFAFICS